ncbi:uncharacterized protein BCR38DRAFT_489093 [Pseudomassariella vexata]|uniref:Uncharacterized protein n=1 Tax=Pseudomassariella vexata TaxID=1141098 RepID=A0A1Y2DHY6_9PEZI|nr:uncharacterized protein BCR38DRAFT_489093 [Pseudomassariella vexata]ORY58736.1 hypothetical protein BCR38DRAFT_489093 [Pseudomassariella vexata]
MADEASTSDCAPTLSSFEATFRTFVSITLRETIAEKLKHEGLRLLEKARDEAIWSIKPGDGNPWFLSRQQQHLYVENCRELLQRCRPWLHAAIDEMLDELDQEADSDGTAALSTWRSPPITPRPISNAFLITPTRVSAATPQTKAPVAPMESPCGRMRSPAKSVTLPATEHDPELNNVEKETVGATGAASTLILTSAAGTSKRRNNDPEASKESNKRVKTASKPTTNPVQIIDVYRGECIFRYKDSSELYVLRCNLTKCKEKGRPLFFQADPFKYNRALNHFGGEVHNIKDPDEIWIRYARRVIGAASTRNLGTPKSKQPDISPISTETPNRLRNGAPSPTTSPTAGRDKGKQPEKPTTPLASRAASGTAKSASSTSPYVQNKQKQQPGASDSPNLFSLRDNSKSPPNATRTTKNLFDSTDSDSDFELPTLEEIAAKDHNTRRLKEQPSYLIRPYVEDEFK